LCIRLDRVEKVTVLDFEMNSLEKNNLAKLAYTMLKNNRENDQLYGYITEIAKQDRTAFKQFYYEFSPRLANFLFKFLKQNDYVEEAVGDVMLVVWQNAARYTPSSKVSTWVFGIAYKKALKILARDRTSQSRYVSFEEEEMDITIEDCERPDFLAQHAELHHAIVGALDALSASHRAVIEMVFFEGFTYPEIAEILDCPVNTVKTRVYHAKKQLMNHLNAHQ
jgi:RNA polymerase sigma-70 factor, ECF subfamily